MTTRLISIILVFAAVALLWATPTGPNSPGTNDAGWTNSGNAHSQSDTYADGSFNLVVQYTNFGFDFTSSSVDGVMVETDSYKTGTKNNTIIYNLLNVGTCTLKESAILDTTDTDTYTEFGGATDTWSCTALTEANVESSSFGVHVEGDKDGGANPDAGSYHLDHLRVTVYYTAPSGAQVIVIARRTK